MKLTSPETGHAFAARKSTYRQHLSGRVNTTMPRLSQPPAEDFRRVLREKALSHSLFYLKLSSSGDGPASPGLDASAAAAPVRVASAPALAPTGSECARAPPTTRVRRARDRDPASARFSALVRHFEPRGPMQYLRPPRARPSSPTSDDTGDICSSDDDDRAAVRRRSRDLSDDSAVELEPRRRRPPSPPERDAERRAEEAPAAAAAAAARRERTLVEAHFVELGGAGERWEVRGRCVRTPSVVVSDYSDVDGACAGATPEEAAWLRARALSADSACSSCSTLSSREDDELDSPPLTKKMISAE